MKPPMLGAGCYMIYFIHIYQKRAFCFTLLQNELNTDVARLTTQESNLSCNKSRCCRWQKVVAESRVLDVTFCKKICTRCAFYRPKANLPCSK